MLTPLATSHTQDADVSPPPASLRGSVFLAAALLVVLVLYGYSVVRTAWLSDDSYITFRTIENLLAGHGPTWNTDERVQAYTHPLWMFLLAAVRAVTGEIYYSSLLLSMALSLAAVLVVALGIARTWGQALLAVAICTFSKAFVDFSTSGLENPLSYLLVAWFLGLYFRGEGQGARDEGTGDRGQGTASNGRQAASGTRRGSDAGLLPLSLLGSMIVLNRMDLALIVGPALLHAFWRNRSLKALGLVALGFLPFIAWEVFSVIFYGFPFPNTAYAKLNTGIAAADLARHGLDYLGNSLHTDPLTLVVVAAALVAAVIGRDDRRRALAAGIALYLVYIVRIGGDFMSGRFLAVILLASVALLATLPLRWRGAAWLSGALLAACLGLAAPDPSVLTTNVYGLAWSWRPDVEPIVDERAYYYPETGLLSDRLGIPPSTPRFVNAAERFRKSGQRVADAPTIGMFGYYMGPNIHVIDHCALADPLLARLPMKDDPNWRIGHFTRHVPDGYIEKLQSEANHLSDPNLDAFYEKIRLISRGPLFSRQRWRAIWDMNLGRYDSLIDREFYRHPPERVWLSQVSGGPRPRNVKELPHRPDGVFDLPPAGFLVALGATIHAPTLEINVEGGREYRIDYPQPGRFPVRQEIPATSSQPARITRRIDVPPEVAYQGYDRLRICPAGPGPHSLGLLRPIGETTDKVTQ